MNNVMVEHNTVNTFLKEEYIYYLGKYPDESSTFCMSSFRLAALEFLVCLQYSKKRFTQCDTMYVAPGQAFENVEKMCP